MDTKSEGIAQVTYEHHDLSAKESSTESLDVDHAQELVKLADDVAATKYKPFTQNMIRLYLVLIIPYLCGCLNGYDGSLMGGLNAMQTYQDFFHM